jgi:hypothetical protein
VIDEEHHLARPESRSGGSAGGLEERAGEGESDENERRASKGEEEQVPELLPPHRSIGDLAQEHERGEGNDLFLLAVREVNDDGDREGEGTEEKEGRE